jgi:hypothetical protein
MQLLVAEIKSTLYQALTNGRTVAQVYAVRPHLYRHGSPAGTIKLQIQDASGVLIAESAAQTISAIGSGTYWHGYLEFVVSAQLAKNAAYRFALVPAGYTFSEGAYLGWCNGFDLGKYGGTYAPAVGFSAPLDLEIWTRGQMRKGVA